MGLRPAGAAANPAESGTQAVVFSGLLCHKPAFRRPAKGLPWRRNVPERIQQKWTPVLRPDALENAHTRSFSSICR
jgi:hypothetical protein